MSKRVNKTERYKTAKNCEERMAACRIETWTSRIINNSVVFTLARLSLHLRRSSSIFLHRFRSYTFFLLSAQTVTASQSLALAIRQSSLLRVARQRDGHTTALYILMSAIFHSALHGKTDQFIIRPLPPIHWWSHVKNVLARRGQSHLRFMTLLPTV